LSRFDQLVELHVLDIQVVGRFAEDEILPDMIHLKSIGDRDAARELSTRIEPWARLA
jgi:hypothetical protein